MWHNWNNRSRRGVFGLCSAVWIAVTVGSLFAQENPTEPLNNASPQAAGRDTVKAEEAALPDIDRVLLEQYQRVMIIDFDGPIFGSQHAYLNNRLDRGHESSD